jgi:SsrA-binding protein
MAKGSEDDGRKVVARNKKARYRYHVEDRVEAGMVLVGTEVKSLRAGRVALADSFARFRGAELFLLNCHISPYEKAHRDNHEPMRPRKLLLHRRELKRLRTKVEERGHTLIPLSLYFLRGKAKVELGLCRGKRQRDRREDLKRRDAERELRRAQH